MHLFGWHHMSRLLCALCLLALLPNAANASSYSSIANTNCSGDLTISVLDGASFACAGNLTLDGGFVTSDSLINISADGNLFLDNLTLTAPTISFSVLTGMLTLGSNMVISAGSNFTATGEDNAPVMIRQITSNSVLSGSEFNISQGSAVIFNQRGVSKAVLDRVVGAAGVISVGNSPTEIGGNLSFSNTSGIAISQLTNTPVVGGALSLGSGSGELVIAGAVLNEPLFSVAAVPEPSTYAMMFLGILGLVTIRRQST
jgi:filamentous hemagglutinin family protein